MVVIDEKSPDAFRTIGEAADQLGVAQHVLRFWEGKFHQLKPVKRRGRRYYRPEDIVLLQKVKHLLYDQGYTIKGVQKCLNQGKQVLERRMQEGYHAVEVEEENSASELSRPELKVVASNDDSKQEGEVVASSPVGASDGVRLSKAELADIIDDLILVRDELKEAIG